MVKRKVLASKSALYALECLWMPIFCSNAHTSPTRPSCDAQADLIRACYDRIGLDPTNPNHRPQYFEAHGTGTPAGKKPLNCLELSASQHLLIRSYRGPD